MDMVNFMVNLARNILLQRWSGNVHTYDCSTTFPLCITLPPMFFRLLLFCYKQVMKNLRDIFKTYKLLYSEWICTQLYWLLFIFQLLNLQNDSIYVNKLYKIISIGLREVQTNWCCFQQIFVPRISAFIIFNDSLQYKPINVFERIV